MSLFRSGYANFFFLKKSEHIKNNSIHFQVVEGLQHTGWLIGDSGYMQRCRMMIPFGHKAKLTSAQKRYQTAQIKCRNTVERTIGILKSRFRCLDHKSRGAMQFSPEKSAVVIACCAILHNYCRRRNLHTTILPHIQEELVGDRQAVDPAEGPSTVFALENCSDNIKAGNRARTELIRAYFNSN
jgi:hypothetical protein